MKAVFLFVDGLGLGKPDSAVNPCAGKNVELLSVFEDGRDLRPAGRNGFCASADARLGVEGIPQSATGQATLFTGVNCARLIESHLKGFPNEALRGALREDSILKKLKEAGRRPAFVNAYRPIFFKLKEKTQWRLSATTVANLAAGLPFRTIEDLTAGEALYHDFTNSFLVKTGFNVPLQIPAQAGTVLARLSLNYDFVVYEYFLTDRAGHSQDMVKAYPIILQYDRFLGALLDAVDLNQTLVILASDHGNVEDLSTPGHTLNRVPVMFWGKEAETLAPKVRSLTDVAPVILETLGAGTQP
jgi:hypothetical protein